MAGGEGAAYVLLAVAIGFFTLSWPNIRSGLSVGSLRTDLMSPAQLRDQVVELRAQTQLDLNQEAERLRSLGTAEHTQYLARTRQELAEAKLKREASKGLFPAIRPTIILERKRLDLQISALERKIGASKQPAERTGSGMPWNLLGKSSLLLHAFCHARESHKKREKLPDLCPYLGVPRSIAEIREKRRIYFGSNSSISTSISLRESRRNSGCNCLSDCCNECLISRPRSSCRKSFARSDAFFEVTLVSSELMGIDPPGSPTQTVVAH